ncbi:MAG: hypothetical protein K2J85_01040 [Anaeroplasmataceae bacterium]|nr:hypothetical protein [Anaeroplasmataceae bacterium]
MAKEIKKNEFRKANDKKHGEHPAYIYAQKGKKLIFIGITHSKITEGMDNIPLEKNPEPGNKTPAYIRPNPDEAHRSSFGAKLKGWFFSNNDKKKVEEVKKRHKK